MLVGWREGWGEGVESASKLLFPPSSLRSRKESCKMFIFELYEEFLTVFMSSPRVIITIYERCFEVLAGLYNGLQSDGVRTCKLLLSLWEQWILCICCVHGSCIVTHLPCQTSGN